VVLLLPIPCSSGELSAQSSGPTAARLLRNRPPAARISHNAGKKSILRTRLQQIHRAPLERRRAHSDRALDQQNVMLAEFLKLLIEVEHGLGNRVGFIVRIVQIVDLFNRAPAAGQIDRLEAAPNIGNDFQQHAECGRLMILGS
jgi:hypothetical protein